MSNWPKRNKEANYIDRSVAMATVKYNDSTFIQVYTHDVKLTLQNMF